MFVHLALVATLVLALPAFAAELPIIAGDFVTVPAGCFPARGKQTCVDSFLIGKYEVTQGLYKRIMESNPSVYSSCGDDCPVDQVSWNDAQEFIKRLNSQTGKHYRLPTEAEWEYACRSGGKNEEFCGGDTIDAVAWYEGNSDNKPHPVGQKKPNGLGLYDMSGNVWEWVNDRYGDNSFPSSGKNPQGPASGEYRVNRGGSWNNIPNLNKAKFRGGNTPDTKGLNCGFRLAS
jgi:formylglycine-generating enzyme required for sulfatase activity